MKTVEDIVREHAAEIRGKCTSTMEGLHFLGLENALENIGAANLYLAALGIINSIRAILESYDKHKELIDGGR